MVTVDTAAVLLMQTWFSASFPTGAFSFSHGLEYAIEDGRLHDAASCEGWLRAILEHGSGWNDALLFAAAWRAVNDDDDAALRATNELALALCAGAERLHETTAQGAAFRDAARAWSSTAGSPGYPLDQFDRHSQSIALPVASGASCHRIPLSIAIAVATQSLLSNLVWIAVRLVPLGQSDGLAIISDLAPAIQSMAARAARSSLADVGSGALVADIASLQHEQLATRVCQS